MANSIQTQQLQSNGTQANSGNRKSWVIRILLGSIVIVILLGISGFTYETVAHGADMRNYPGQRIDVGGYSLHINCIGSESPTVILESGMGESSLSWAGLHTQLAEITGTRVCAYDRAGYGWSDAAPDDVDRSAEQLVVELHTLLNNAGVEPPYVLVGHSLGGLLARLYTSNYPEEIVGLVLLDSAHEEILRVAPQFADALSMQRNFQSTFSSLASFGVVRVFGHQLVAGMSPDFPEALKLYIPVMYSASAFQTANRELDGLVQTWEQIEAARAANVIWTIPVHVLYSTQTSEATPGWSTLQTDLGGLSENSEVIVVEKAGHFIHYGEPDLVIDVIGNTVDEVRGF